MLHIHVFERERETGHTRLVLPLLCTAHHHAQWLCNYPAMEAIQVTGAHRRPKTRAVGEQLVRGRKNEDCK